MVLKSVTLIIEFVVGSLIGIAILAGLAIWRIAGEPVSLTFLTPYLEQALSAEDGSFTAKVDDTQLTWEGWQRRLDIRVRGARAIGPDGQVLASIPDMAVALSIRGLLHGVVAPTSLEIFHPKVRIVRAADGGFNLGFEDAGPKAGDLATGLITDLMGPPNVGHALGYLSSVRVTSAQLTLVDEKMGTTWYAPHADVTVRRDVRGIDAQAALGLDLGGPPAEIDADLSYNRDARKIDLGLTFGNLSPARLVAKQKFAEELAGFSVPLAGTLTASLDIDGHVESLGFDITGGPGSLKIPKMHAEALPITKVVLHGRAEGDLSRWVVDRFHAELGGPTLDVTGHVFRTGTDLAAQGQVIVSDMPVDSLMRYWPATVAADARTWIKGHISKGNIPETRAVVALQAPKGDLGAIRLDSIAGTFKAQGLTVAYLPPMPPAENVTGRATFTTHELDVAIDGGTLKGINVTEGKVAITGLDVEDQDAAIDIVLQGPVGDIMEVLDSEPVKAAGFLGTSPANMGGQAAVRARFKFPLLKNLRFAQVRFGAAANVRGASIKQAALHQDLDSGDMTVKVDETHVQADGTMRLGGVPANLSATLYFADPAPYRARYAVTAQVSDADLARFGFPVAPYVTGEIPLSLAFVEAADGTADLQLKADLGQAAMTAEELGWSKPKGTPGTGSMALTLAHGFPVAVREFSLSAGNLTANGNGTFALVKPGAGPETRLERIDLTHVAFGRTDVAGRITFRADGGTGIELRGPQIDAAHYFSLKDGTKPKEEKKKRAPLAIGLAADTLWTGPATRVLNARLSLDEVDDRWRSLDFQGAMPNPDPKAKENPAFRISIARAPQGNSRYVSVAAGDAGLFLHTFGIFDDMQGGAMNLDGTIDDADPDHPFTGRVLAKNYRITRAPFLAKLMTAASLTGILNLMAGEGIGFTDLKANLTLRKDKLGVTDGRAFGADIGLTMNGTLDLQTNIADMQGTVVPAYAINSILGNIPILGDILTGGEGSGIFAATYRLTGDIRDPKVDVNPLAALTPGVLRNIFEIFGEPGSSEAKPAVQKPGLQKQ